MENEKKIGMVIEGSGSREEVEKKAYDNLRPMLLRLLKKAISKGYKEKGDEKEVAVRMSITLL